MRAREEGEGRDGKEEEEAVKMHNSFHKFASNKPTPLFFPN